MPANYNKAIYRWLLTGCALIFVMVIIGGITRLTGSGLSIVRWDIVTGTLPPLNENAWNKSFDLYKQTPQFQKINFDFTLVDYKEIFWWEYIHRLIGRIIGVVFIVPFFYFLVKQQLSKKLIPKLIIIFLLGGAQGALGWYMVKSGLAYNPHVSHLRLAAHLLTAFLAFGYTYKTALEVRNENAYKGNENIYPGILRLSQGLFVLAVIQIMYGAFVAGLHAGLVYNTWPTMEGQWIPEGLFFTSPLWSDLIDNSTTVQFLHRLFAYLLTVGIVILFFRSRRQANSNIKKSCGYLIIIVTIQLLLGILTLLTKVNIYFALIHQAGAFMLFAGFVYHLNALRNISAQR
jgi:cytochrome c oxidase assembly protein subunit 15